jgi:hypothetical protein
LTDPRNPPLVGAGEAAQLGAHGGEIVGRPDIEPEGIGRRRKPRTKIVSTILRGGPLDMGQVIMLGTLFGLLALIYGLVLRFDPEARRAEDPDGDR